MESYYIVIIKMLYLFLGLIFLRSAISKIRRPFKFYIAIQDYKIIKNKEILVTIVPILITLELALGILLITTLFSHTVLIMGIIVQLFYIIVILINMNKQFNNNCNCFTLNAPQKVTTKSLAVNIILILAIITVYGWEVRL